ncbi:MAG TPA: Gfo/Idh/MocA family oxidoreductase [Candidatus Eremiobacteraeota bacterium]|nr:MAG: putative oxidoreductase [bacterium ADurb.Bin363]HPZ07433.1 Gfo/Idh/MocA family oxidoreductase [Candidatus Eremiobacteraeota bacterium]
MKEILLSGYGSIGKRHAKNLLAIGFFPYVLTNYSDDNKNIKFIKRIEECSDIDYGIIATPTAFHMSDFVKLKERGCKNVLIEKPVENKLGKALEIKKIAEISRINVYVGYNMRFLRVFEAIKDTIDKYFDKIRIVKITAGQYLPEWRPYKDYRKSYSAIREQGGGVDLDLSHETDYMNWLYGLPVNIDYTYRANLSSLEINSPDYFKGIYRYKTFLVDLELDYIRKKERSIKIIGENVNILYADFINRKLIINDNVIDDTNLFDFEKCYIDEMKEFLNLEKRDKIATLDDGIKALELLNMEE